MTTALPRHELEMGGPAQWLVDLQVGGRVYRWAETRETIALESGDEVTYAEGLGRLELSLDAVASGSGQTIDVVADDDWALLVARGLRIEGAELTLRRWIPGTTLERARVALVAEVVEVGYDRAGAPLSLSVAVQYLRLADATTRPRARINQQTWPITGGFSRDKELEGASYPVVFGSPGSRPDGTIVPAVPVPMCERNGSSPNNRVVLSYLEIASTVVTLFQLDDTLSAVRAVSVVQDGRGLEVSTATVGAPLSSGMEGSRLYAGFAGIGGGILRPDRSRALRGAGEITRFVLERWCPRIRLDSARLAEVEDRMDAYQIDTWLNSDSSWWSWLTGELWPLLPVLPAQGPGGLYLRWYDWSATHEQSIADLDADGRELVRQPGVRLSGSPGPNEVTLQYAPARDSDRYLEEVIVTSEVGRRELVDVDETITDTRIVSSPYAVLGRSLYRRRPETRATALTWDQATATLIALGIVEREAVPRRLVDYVGGHVLESLPIASVVTITDSELYLDGTPAIVLDVLPRGPECRLSLALLEPPFLTAPRP